MSDLENCYIKIMEILGPDYKEPLEVIKTVEEYRQYWKPKVVKTLLLAESHVYTTSEDYSRRKNKLDSILPNYPSNFVRFVYCINYRETRQFWRIFYSTLNWIESHQDFEFIKDFNNKLKILQQMKERGIWLVDASICGLYIPGGSKPRPIKVKQALCCSWNGYVKNVIEKSKPERIVVIGKTVWNEISQFFSSELLSKSNWVYQPNARLEGDGHIKNYQKIFQLCNNGTINNKSFDFIKTSSKVKTKNKTSNKEKSLKVYEFSRLSFLAKVIESLNAEESFRIICPEGTFQMTKNEFYSEFKNVVQSRSYREKGIYHYPKPPGKALKFIIR